MGERPAYQQRVIEERDGLQEKMNRLYDFVENSPNFASLDAANRSLLVVQHEAMGAYRKVLDERIALFEE
jgi:hypothetical protein